jgi:phosphoribosylaminoimidazolecarboxamide formyltransferase/IMP cyclohydrolase
MTQPPLAIRRALISVSDKTNIVTLAQALYRQGIEILSTGGTAQLLKTENIPLVDVATYTQFPEIMGGRVKTLHPKVHGGILGRRGQDDAIMQTHDIPPIDLVIVNLYPFSETIKKENTTLAEAVEQIDIGGPAMIRAAAKNHDFVTVITDPSDYPELIRLLEEHQQHITYPKRLEWAAKAFALTARYDFLINHYLEQQCQAENEDENNFIEFTPKIELAFTKLMDLRYGENPHQRAAFYAEELLPNGTFATANQLQGTTLSFNNIADADAAFAAVLQLQEKPACVIVKHANPCGVAIGASSSDAYQLAFRTDPQSAFGGIIAFNRTVDGVTASAIVEQQFVEVIIAPEFSAQALTVFAKKPKIRLLACQSDAQTYVPKLDFKRISGGLLIQEGDRVPLDQYELATVTKISPTAQQMEDLLFAWRVAKFVKSNAIVYAKDLATLGIGAGQMSRIDSARLASEKALHAQLALIGGVMASDAFFPFTDCIEHAAKLGIKAIIQPGGSIRDAEVIACADELGLAMLCTHVRHFRH